MGKKINKLAVLFLILLVFCNEALAFKPNDSGHLGQTSSALKATTRTINGETLQFSEKAIEQVRQANEDTDCFPSCQKFASYHFDDEDFSGATARIKQLKASIIQKITAATPNGASARKDLGGALHTLQDFYAHSTWVELGNTGIDTRLGNSTFSGLPLATATCPTDAGTLGGAGLTSMTSGWFKIPLCVPPAGKCRHGIPIACPDGLNKDTADRPGYATANQLAELATRDFLNQILDDPSVAGNAKAIKALMDVKSTLGMVIDDTGSMGSVISAVKSQVTAIINSVRGTEDEPAQYLLVRFGDPDVGAAYTTNDADAYIARVNSLSAFGGGDCPELSMSGMVAAVAASQNDATLYLFSDASAKDSSLASNVAALANSKGISIIPLLFGSCSPIDPAYYEIAEKTGGQVFVLTRSEAGNTFSLIKPQLPGDLTPITMANGIMGATEKRFDVPIDSSISNATFSVSLGVKGSITLTKPDGTLVTSIDSDVVWTELSTGRVVTVNNPMVGNWRLAFTGSGDFTAVVQGNSDLTLHSFGFMEVASRPAHESLRPLSDQPISDSTQISQASLFSGHQTASFSLIAENGATLQDVELARNHPDAFADEYVGEMVLPDDAFRVKVQGENDIGESYQRMYSTKFLAQSVSVTSLDENDAANIGQTTSLIFSVENLGADGTFSGIATTNVGQITNLSPASLSLANGETQTVTVDLFLPITTPETNDVVSVTLLVKKSGNPEIQNSATISLPIQSNQPPVCANDNGPILWPANHKMISIDVTKYAAISDPDGDPITVIVQGVTQDEPVLGTAEGSGATSPDAQVSTGSQTVDIRAERDGTGDGRVYNILYIASDGKGGSCTGDLNVTVPHSNNKEPAIDSGQSYDATAR